MQKTKATQIWCVATNLAVFKTARKPPKPTAWRGTGRKTQPSHQPTLTRNP